MNDTDLKKRLIEHANLTGFPSELRAADILRKRKWSNICENTYFIDQDENKGREIDLRAFYLKQEKNAFIVSTACTAVSSIEAEVKKSKNKPWVIFSSEESDIDSFFLKTNLSFLLKNYYNINFDEVNHSRILKKHPSLNKPRIGRTGYVGFTNSTKQIFEAIICAAKACTETFKFTSPHPEMNRKIKFYTPVVILDGLLFECYLKNEELTLNETEAIPFSFNYASPEYPTKKYYVDIVTLKYFEEYIKQHESWVDEILECMTDL